jgi:hypothetical protein
MERNLKKKPAIARKTGIAAMASGLPSGAAVG